MKQLTLLSFLGLLLMGACTKSKSPTPTPSGPGTTTSSPYYFDFTVGSAVHNINTNFPQYMVLLGMEGLGGYEVSNMTTTIPSVGLGFRWWNKDTVRESDVMSLVGRTIYFDDTAINVQINYDSTLAMYREWYSVDTSDHDFYVKVNSITFLKNDTTLSTPVRVYEITGSCSAIIRDQTAAVLTGQFDFLIAGNITK